MMLTQVQKEAQEYFKEVMQKTEKNAEKGYRFEHESSVKLIPMAKMLMKDILNLEIDWNRNNPCCHTIVRIYELIEAIAGSTKYGEYLLEGEIHTYQLIFWELNYMVDEVVKIYSNVNTEKMSEKECISFIPDLRKFDQKLFFIKDLLFDNHDFSIFDLEEEYEVIHFVNQNSWSEFYEECEKNGTLPMFVIKDLSQVAKRSNLRTYDVFNEIFATKAKKLIKTYGGFYIGDMQIIVDKDFDEKNGVFTRFNIHQGDEIYLMNEDGTLKKFRVHFEELK